MQSVAKRHLSSVILRSAATRESVSPSTVPLSECPAASRRKRKNHTPKGVVFSFQILSGVRLHSSSTNRIACRAWRLRFESGST